MQTHERLLKEQQLSAATIEVRNQLRALIPEAQRTSEVDQDHWIQELILHVGSHTITDLVAGELRLSTEKRHELFQDRLPYSSVLQVPENREQREALFISVGKYLLAQYELEAITGEVSDTTRFRLKDFLNTARRNLFQEERRDIEDAFLGIDPGWKQTGEVVISEDVPNIVRHQVEIYLRDHQENQKTEAELTAEVLVYLQGGQLSLVAPLLNQTSCPEDVYQVASQLSDSHFTEPELIERKMRFAVDNVQFLRMMGISVEKYFQIFGYKSVPELQRIMSKYLTDDKLVDSFADVLKKGFPEETDDWSPETVFPLSYREVQRRLAHGTPAELTSFETIQARSTAKFETATQKLRNRFPFAASPNVSIENYMPHSKGVKIRSACFSYWDEARRMHSIIAIDAATRPDDLQTAIFHERGHGLHYALMGKAVKAGWYSETDIASVPSSFLEEVALFFQESGKEETSPVYKTGAASESVQGYTGIYEAIGKRYYAQMGLMQLQLFTAIEAELAAGHTIDPVQLHDELSPRMAEIRNQGLAFRIANAWLYYTIDPLRMDDGMLYVDPNLSGEKLAAEQDTATVNLAGIFRQRFGLEPENLSTNKEARALFLYALAVSGKAEWRRALPEKLASITIDEVRSRLSELGIQIEDI